MGAKVDGFHRAFFHARAAVDACRFINGVVLDRKLCPVPEIKGGGQPSQGHLFIHFKYGFLPHAFDQAAGIASCLVKGFFIGQMFVFLNTFADHDRGKAPMFKKVSSPTGMPPFADSRLSMLLAALYWSPSGPPKVTKDATGYGVQIRTAADPLFYIQGGVIIEDRGADNDKIVILLYPGSEIADFRGSGLEPHILKDVAKPADRSFAYARSGCTREQEHARGAAPCV